MKHTFGRGKPTLRPQELVLVLCEDTKSCKDYLEDAKHYFRSIVTIEHCGTTCPFGIVTKAVARSSGFDHVYCAVDRDRHEKFDAAVLLASQHSPKITLVTSYPCYEFWLYLHFKESRKPYAAQGNLSPGDCIIKDLSAVPDMADYDKGKSSGVFTKLLPRLPEAKERAKRVLKAAESDESLNPSTRLHELLAAFEALGKPQAVN